MAATSSQSLILFDGVCNLCNAAVTFIIKRDNNQYFQFASLQSKTGQAILRQLGRSTDQFDSFVLWENGRFYDQSTAALRVARQLSGGWPLLYSFILLPKGFRDTIYKFIARHRYQWFGQRDTCMLPTPELKDRFFT